METITNRTLLFGLIYHYALEIFQVLVVVVSGGMGTQILFSGNWNQPNNGLKALVI